MCCRTALGTRSAFQQHAVLTCMSKDETPAPERVAHRGADLGARRREELVLLPPALAAGELGPARGPLAPGARAADVDDQLLGCVIR